MKPSRVVLAALSLAVLRTTAWPTPRVLFATGDRAADGIGVATIAAPQANDANDVAFAGSSSAVVVGRAGVFDVLAATGDPLPAPLAGTFNDFVPPTITASGTVVFAASINGEAAHSAVFAAGPGGTRPIVMRESVIGAVSVNAAGDVVIRADDIRLWQHDTGTEVVVASPRDTLFDERRIRSVRFLGRPVVGPTRAVAFVAHGRRSNSDGIFLWRPVTGSVPIVRDGGHGSLPGWRFDELRRAPLSVNAAEQVAFVADFCASDGCGTGIFRADAAVGSLEVVARTGQLVGAGRVGDIDDHFIGLGDAGRVVFLAGIGRDRWLVASESGRLTALARVGRRARGFTPGLEEWRRIGWVREGYVEGLVDGMVQSLAPVHAGFPAGGFRPRNVAASARGDVAFLSVRAGVYRLRDGPAAVVVSDGSVLAGSGTVGELEGAVDFRFVGDELVLLLPLDAGYALARSTPAGLVPLVTSGRPTPFGGTFELEADSLARADTTSDALLFVARRAGGRPALYRLHTPTGEVEGLLDGPIGLELVPGGGEEPVVAAGFADGRSALLVVRKGGTQPIVTTGRRFTRIDAAVAGLRRTFFVGFAARRGTERPVGLFARGRGPRAATRRLFSRGARAPGGGTVTDLIASVTLRGSGLALRVDEHDAIFAVRGRRLVPVLRNGDPLCGGAGRISDLEAAWVVHRRAVALGYIERPDALVPRAVLEWSGDSPCPIAFEGERTLLGGRFGSLQARAISASDRALVFAAPIVGGRARAALFAADAEGATR